MKPDWRGAPGWASWLAQDEDGSWWWYEEKPRASFCVWVPADSKRKRAFNPKNCDGWENTLEQRPEPPQETE